MADVADAPKGDETPKLKTVTRKQLAARVQKATGAKLADVQLIMRATLLAMSDALKAGENLRLPPFGAARVLRQADPVTGQAMRFALREVKPKEKTAKPAARKAAKPAPAANRATPTPAPKGAMATPAANGPNAKRKRAVAAKQALAAKDEAD